MGILLPMILVLSFAFPCFAEITADVQVKIDTEDYTYTLYANASDTENGALTYQWYKCNASGNNAVLIDGADGNVYQPARSEKTAYYFCEITSTTEADTNSVRTKVVQIEDVASNNPEEETEIMTFSVKGIDAPVTGNAPDADVEISKTGDNAGYTVTSVNWEPKNSKFQPETVYTITVNVKLSEGFKAGSGFKCLINGNSAVVTGDASKGEFGFYYTFPATAAAEEEPQEEEEAPALPAPLGIPGWIWAAIIIVLVAALIIAFIARAKAKKRDEGRHNYVSEIYEEKNTKRETNEPPVRETRRRGSQAEPVREDPPAETDNNDISYYDNTSEQNNDNQFTNK